MLLVRFYLEGDDLRTPHAKPYAVSAELDSLAKRLATRLDAGHDTMRVVEALRGLLFEEEGFHGNRENYYNYQNSLLDHVLVSRTGIPISLAVVFAAVCRRVGVHLDFVGMPGHLLLATRPRAQDPRVFVDSFHGGALLGHAQCKEGCSLERAVRAWRQAATGRL